MTLRRIAPILLVLVAAFAAPGAAVAGPIVFTDPAEGSSAPDITRIAVGNDSLTLTADIRLDNRAYGLDDQDTVTLYLDTDGSAVTGDPDHHGADHFVQAVSVSGQLHGIFGVWMAGGWTTPPSPGVSASWAAPDLRLRATLAELGDPTGVVHLSVVAVWNGIVDYTDLAPDPPAIPFAYTVGAGTPPVVTDTTRPTTRITSGPSGRRTLHRATFRFASSEKGSTFMCRLDSRPWRSCSSPKTYRGLRKGRHVFRVYAKDKAGNRDLTPAIRRWRIA